MLLKLFNIQIKIRRPIVFVRDDMYELTLRLVEPVKLYPIMIPRGYQLRSYTEADRDSMLELLTKCGLNFSKQILDDAIKLCIPEGIHLVEQEETGRLVSMMMSRHLSSEEFAFGGRIDWLATDPHHRGKGLGKLSAALATQHLLDRGYKNIWATTQPSRPAAIRVFSSLGFSPTDKTLKHYEWSEIVNSINAC